MDDVNERVGLLSISLIIAQSAILDNWPKSLHTKLKRYVPESNDLKSKAVRKKKKFEKFFN